VSTVQSDPRDRAAHLLTYLRQLKNDRGAMANLRCAMSPTRLARAWPLLARVGGISNARIQVVAGLFAYHPQEAITGNLGTTCRLLCAGNKSFDDRFRRLLSCDRQQILQRLRPIILAAKAKGVPVNYEELYIDLSYWGQKRKARWAREYWPAAGEEAAGAVEATA
jgi:CRISPR system Cascade subunit CasB